MALLTPQERSFCAGITSLTACNHFSDERFPLMKSLLGNAYRDQGDAWHWQSTLTDDPNIDELATQAATLAESLHQRLQTVGKLADSEFKPYVGLIWWVLYHELRETLLEHVREQRQSPKPVSCRKVYSSFLKLYQRYFDANDPRVTTIASPDHLFSLFFQLRRAFVHIFYYMVGGSPAAARLRSRVWESIFTHDSARYMQVLYKRMNAIPTLITGETGTGKELIARAIALSRYIPFDPESGKFAESYVESLHPVNLSALSPTLVESELFGHRRGSFTGAFEDRAGYLEACSQYGSVFLDEIGELSPEIQVKLLRALEDRSFNRLGDPQTRQFHGKIIAATNRDLALEVHEQTFREDFYYRLCADQVRAPSLREQLREAPEELANLVRFMARKETDEEAGEQLAKSTMTFINNKLGADYPWPGNFREVGQCVRSILVHNEYVPLRRPKSTTGSPLVQAAQSGDLSINELLTHYCTLVYQQAGSYQEAARRLDCDHRTIKKYAAPSKPS